MWLFPTGAQSGHLKNEGGAAESDHESCISQVKESGFGFEADGGYCQAMLSSDVKEKKI